MAETSGNLALSPAGTPGGHAACDAVFARMKARAEAAEAELAVMEKRVRQLEAVLVGQRPASCGDTHSATCTGCGGQYADEESGAYLFTSREGLERHLDADRWQADPVLCPACQPEEPAP